MYNAIVRLNKDGSFSLVETNCDGKVLRHPSSEDGNWFSGSGASEIDAIHNAIARSGILEEFNAERVDLTVEEFQNTVYVVRNGWIYPAAPFEWGTFLTQNNPDQRAAGRPRKEQTK